MRGRRWRPKWRERSFVGERRLVPALAAVDDGPHLGDGAGDGGLQLGGLVGAVALQDALVHGLKARAVGLDGSDLGVEARAVEFARPARPARRP